ncbi:hypothetical protein ACHQM5_016411 [Ranunculus cassubicifolius]
MAFSFSPSPQQSNPFQIQQQQQQSPFSQQNNQFQQQQFQQQQFQQQQQQQFQQQQQSQQQQQQQQQPYLFTNEKTPATYNTKWADLHPDSQKRLLQIEERVLEYRDESQRLDQCSRLYDSSVSNDGFELDASHIVQELGGISASMERERASLQELTNGLKDMMRNTEVAVRSFMMLRPRFTHLKAGTGSNVTAPTQPPAISQQTSTALAPVYDFYTGIQRKPSPFFQQTVLRFEKYLAECRQCIEELEQLLRSYPNGKTSGSDSSLLQSLPKVMTNVHEFFVHVAAKVESLHQYIESMKMAYLADQRRRGDVNDPFLEADRRELAKQEAAAKRVHPTLHLPSRPQPSTQIAGLHTTTSNTLQLPPPTSTASTGLSLFSTPTSAPSATAATSSPSLFATPTVAAPQSSIFGSASSGSLFGSTPTPSLFGNNTPAFGQTAATGTSLFSTPFASGTTGSGSSFGNPSKTSRPKTRTSRR